jgi:hypothetical protein
VAGWVNPGARWWDEAGEQDGDKSGSSGEGWDTWDFMECAGGGRGGEGAGDPKLGW